MIHLRQAGGELDCTYILRHSSNVLSKHGLPRSGLAAGARVQVKGLQAGRVCVCGQTAAQALWHDSTFVALELVAACQVRPELNGLRGKVVEWDEAEGRWKARCDGMVLSRSSTAFPMLRGHTLEGAHG